MDSLIGQLIIVIAAVIVVPEIFRKLKISGSTVMLGVFIAVAAYVFFSKGGVQMVIASIMGR
jgi:high-affinity Fe2+/Pb2+ permease